MSLAASRQEKEDKSGTECSVAEVAWFYGTMVDSLVFTSFALTTVMEGLGDKYGEEASLDRQIWTLQKNKSFLGDSCPPHQIRPGAGIHQVKGHNEEQGFSVTLANMAELAPLVTPGQFKAKNKDPERMLGDFKDYIKPVKDMMVVTGKEGATAAVKKAILRAVGGKDMVSLFDYVGKVADGDTFNKTVTKIEEEILMFDCQDMAMLEERIKRASKTRQVVNNNPPPAAAEPTPPEPRQQGGNRNKSRPGTGIRPASAGAARDNESEVGCNIKINILITFHNLGLNEVPASKIQQCW